MLVETELGEAGIQHDMVLTIGVFDGVHLGHKYLLSCLKEEARKLSALSGVITFKRHPIESLNPAAALPYLVSLDEKVRLLKAEGIDISASKQVIALIAYIQRLGTDVGDSNTASK